MNHLGYFTTSNVPQKHLGYGKCKDHKGGPCSFFLNSKPNSSVLPATMFGRIWLTWGPDHHRLSTDLKHNLPLLNTSSLSGTARHNANDHLSRQQASDGDASMGNNFSTKEGDASSGFNTPKKGIVKNPVSRTSISSSSTSCDFSFLALIWVDGLWSRLQPLKAGARWTCNLSKHHHPNHQSNSKLNHILTPPESPTNYILNSNHLFFSFFLPLAKGLEGKSIGFPSPKDLPGSPPTASALGRCSTDFLLSAE